MSDNLVKRLQGLADCDSRSGEPLGKVMREAAACIEALERDRDEAREVYAKQGGSRLKAELQRIKAEAALAKAVAGLRRIRDKRREMDMGDLSADEAITEADDLARATLAEIAP